MEKLNEKERAFLIGLEKLTRETGIKVRGCGCCGSPKMVEAEITDTRSGYGTGYAGQVEWIDPSINYEWEEFSDSIVKE